MLTLLRQLDLRRTLSLAVLLAVATGVSQSQAAHAEAAQTETGYSQATGLNASGANASGFGELPLLAEVDLLLEVPPLSTADAEGDRRAATDWQQAMADAHSQAEVAPVPEPTAAVLLGGICMLLLLMTVLRRRFDKLAPLPINRS